MGRLRTPAAVLMVTTRTWPSVPGWVIMMRPIRQVTGGVLSSRMITRSLMVTSGVLLFHFLRCCKWPRYSLDHRFQKCCCACETRCHRDNLLVAVKVVSCSGIAFKGAPVRKWPGVKGFRSFGSDDNGVKGRDLRQAWIWVNSVCISSNENNALPATRFK
jgi:hypothetical protein